MSYFNAASHGFPDQDVYAAMVDHLNGQAKPSGGGAQCDEVEKRLDARKAVASVLSADVDQLGFTSTTTTAWHAIISALDLAGKRVLVTEHEWGDFYRALSKRADVEIQVLPSLDFSNPDLSSWVPFIDEDVAAIFVPFVTSISGVRYPVEDIGLLPRPAGTKLIVDAAQALGQTDVNVTNLGCDAIVSTCRKWMRGPRQTALFWINDHWVENGRPIKAQALAPADQNSALIIGLGAAARCFLRHPKHQIEQTLRLQADGLRAWATANGIAVYGGQDSKSATVSLVLDQNRLTAVSDAFNRAEIVGKIVDIRVAEPLCHTPAGPSKVLRLSAHIYNTDSEIQRLTEVISSVL
ncbi:hypothetical protein MNBD_ALPHA07-247 [hydrothermal vent metagenome]|uniref:Aminotransferase class V domain-containing protein n=1 Tax=hydrothermal vent metagenome TaxID=652676 RepID=A0A3B0SCX4_9ZZZZ